MVMKKYMKSLLLAALAVVAAMGFTACSDDDKFTGDPYFTLEGLENMTYDFNYEAVPIQRLRRLWCAVIAHGNSFAKVKTAGAACSQPKVKAMVLSASQP